MKKSAVARLVGVTSLGVAIVGATAMVAFAETGGSRTVRVNVTSAGKQATGDLFVNRSDTAVSDGGRYVVFTTNANVGGTPTGTWNSYLRDTETGSTTHLGANGFLGRSVDGTPSISRDGRYVAFNKTRRDLRSSAAAEPFAVSPTGEPADDRIQSQIISAEGNYITFVSAASNLVYGDTNGEADLFVRDMRRRSTTRVNVTTDNRQTFGYSGGFCECDYSPVLDGRYVVFLSSGADLVPGDTNGVDDVFVRDLVNRTTTRVNVSDGGVQANGLSRSPSITADGRYVVFESRASNLAAGDTDDRWDIFRRDLVEGTTTTIEYATITDPFDKQLTGARISADGRFLSFATFMSTVVPGDTNARGDVFVRDLAAGVNTRVSVSSDGAQGNKTSYDASMSPDGRFVLFTSDATNLVDGDTSVAADLFLRQLD